MAASCVDRRNRTSSDPLTELERAQLEVIGPKYFGGEGGARLAGGDDGDDDPMETRTLLDCESSRIVDGEQHLYDAWFYMGDSGTIFIAGTTTVVAEIVQCGLQCADPDRRRQIGAAMVATRLLPRSDSSYAEFAEQPESSPNRVVRASRRYKVDDRVRIQWRARWYDGRILAIVGDDHYRVSYAGWSSEWDEDVGPERLQGVPPSTKGAKFRARQKVMIHWNQAWYDGQILAALGDQYRVHYDGWDATWDETVLASRLRPMPGKTKRPVAKKSKKRAKPKPAKPKRRVRE